jgi:hypothetical protein
MNELLKFGYTVRRCGADGSTLVLIVLSGCLTCPELTMPFKHLCTAHAFFLKRLHNHCQFFCRTFSEIYVQFDAHLLFFFFNLIFFLFLPGKNCEIDIDECESSPCQYGGTCLERSNQSLYQQAGSQLAPFPEKFSYMSASG